MRVNVGEFTGVLVSILVGAVILGAMISIFGGITIPEGFANGSAIKSMICGSVLLFIGAYFARVRLDPAYRCGRPSDDGNLLLH